jgi:hypothetical protein
MEDQAKAKAELSSAFPRGTCIAAKIYGLNDEARQIRLSQI